MSEDVTRNRIAIDGNEAVSLVACALSEVIAIYPITPASPMGEWADQWSAEGKPNIWGTVPRVVEMQSEGGASAAVHGALQAGSLATTFTASQGLLLMIPTMYKIAAELTPTVFHISARAVAAQALSIFGDHSDVMAVRATGWALLASGSVQESMDMAVIAHTASLETRIPFIHFFEGFRTSHEINTIEPVSHDDLRKLLNQQRIEEFRARKLTPDAPVLRGSSQNPDVFFQARERINPVYQEAAGTIQQAMDRFAEITGRQYNLFDYHGAPDAERVVVIMGSGGEAAHAAVDYLTARGEKVGVVKVRLYRPFDVARFVEALPATTKTIAVLDRTKEPGSAGEPLYLDVINAVSRNRVNGQGRLSTEPRVIGGRYGMGSKEFTPAMVIGVYEELGKENLRPQITVGIDDDVTHLSVSYDPSLMVEPEGVHRAVFFGLGADGTVGANKNSIKIIEEGKGLYAQGYFVYDSRKAGALTVSHLRFGPEPIRAPYLVSKARFVACHQPFLLDKYDVLQYAAEAGTFLLNTPYGPDEVLGKLPRPVAQEIIDKKLRFFVIDASSVAREAGMARRINTVMQACFFAISGVLPQAEALSAISDSIRKTYGKRGPEVVRMNLDAVQSAKAHLHEVQVPDQVPDTCLELLPIVSDSAPEFVRNVTARMLEFKGDELPVSSMPLDGTFPTATSQFDKRNVGVEIPIWEPDLCIECGKCAMVCPHAVIRIKLLEPARLEGAPEGYRTRQTKVKEWKEHLYTIQVSPEDCTGCTLCVDICPARDKREPKRKALNMHDKRPVLDRERGYWEFFAGLPEFDRTKIKITAIKEQQLQQPLFEFPSACEGCGETPYIKLVSQLFGDRALIANATGCSSIYGGNLPTTPYAKNSDGRGPAWCNSLFEDNAEFGLGFRLSVDAQKHHAEELLKRLSSDVGSELVGELLDAPQRSEAEIHEQRERVAALKQRIGGLDSPVARDLMSVADMMVRKSVWIVGGDGWAYDIGYGGLDHVLFLPYDVNLLVLDTEVYSNTGGQMSKATPRGAVAKFAAAGKRASKKDLGLMAMSYGHVYVASVALGAKDDHTLRAFIEAEAYDGPSIIIAYSHCIAHGIDMTKGYDNHKAAVNTGQWLLYRYNPERALRGENPLDLRPPKRDPLEKYLDMENRFKMLKLTHPEEAKRLYVEAQEDVDRRMALYERLAQKPNGGQSQDPE